jgi:putative aldouronate transport system permease protein
MDGQKIVASAIEYDIIIVAIAPIMAVYPFQQKYLVKGAMIGALNG